LVTVETIPTASVLERDKLDGLVQSVDLVCVTDWSRDGLVRSFWKFDTLTSKCGFLQTRVNEACRRLGKPLYLGGTYGLLGYIFCDLLNHEYITPYVSNLGT
jgi:ubiquitin-like 1-activating enzyme E1 A